MSKAQLKKHLVPPQYHSKADEADALGKKNPIPLFLSRFTAKGIEGKSVNQQTETQTLLNPKGYAWASPCLDRKQAADVRKTLKQRRRAS